MAVILNMRVDRLKDLKDNFTKLKNIASNLGIEIEFTIDSLVIRIDGTEDETIAKQLVIAALEAGEEWVDLSSART